MTTATKLRTTVEDYLRSKYEPDCDLVDGELQERNVGEVKHGLLTMAIGIWFDKHFPEWSLLTIAEARVQVRPERYRVADVAVVSDESVEENVLTTAPLIVIEILSPEDGISRYKERLGDYIEMGVKNIWVLDPVKREAHNCSSGAWTPVTRLEVTGTRIFLDPVEIWKRARTK